MTKPQRKLHRLAWFVLTPAAIICVVWAVIFVRPSHATRGVSPAERVKDLVQSGVRQ